jgi:DNA sulfur modification protein DndE
METLDNIRLSVRARNQLSTLKRKTGVPQWNTLCRWAFCLSLSEPTAPRELERGETGVELAWRTFAGEWESIYVAALKQRCQHDGATLDRATLNNAVRMHITRGIGYLVSRVNSIEDVCGLTLSQHIPDPQRTK